MTSASPLIMTLQTLPTQKTSFIERTDLRNQTNEHLVFISGNVTSICHFKNCCGLQVFHLGLRFFIYSPSLTISNFLHIYPSKCQMLLCKPPIEKPSPLASVLADSKIFQGVHQPRFFFQTIIAHSVIIFLY